uniref:Methyltransf_21 domain-containing protein n=1 Tax=Syphacia muris TaxID=451379 RepID=A0A0N5AA67_9BILA
MRECEDNYYDFLSFPLQVLPNVKEVKHARMPVRQLKEYEKCIVTIFGIGKNLAAETALRQLYPSKCHFYGLDPSPDPNKKLLESINGTYYQAAIASKFSMKDAVLLTNNGYKHFTIKHEALEDYLKNQLEKTDIIDWASVDIEGGEVELFPSFLRGGTFDKLNITICQLNMELHLEKDKPNDNAAIYEFLHDATIEKRYMFMKVARPYFNRITYYAVNIKDPNCVNRYVKNDLYWL